MGSKETRGLLYKLQVSQCSRSFFTATPPENPPDKMLEPHEMASGGLVALEIAFHGTGITSNWF